MGGGPGGPAGVGVDGAGGRRQTLVTPDQVLWLLPLSQSVAFLGVDRLKEPVIRLRKGHLDTRTVGCIDPLEVERRERASASLNLAFNPEEAYAAHRLVPLKRERPKLSAGRVASYCDLEEPLGTNALDAGIPGAREVRKSTLPRVAPVGMTRIVNQAKDTGRDFAAAPGLVVGDEVEEAKHVEERKLINPF